MKARKRRKSGKTQPQSRTRSKPVVANLLQTAVAHHQAGQLVLAEALYGEILEQRPNCADALHLMGVLALQTGRPEVAVDYIGRAAARNPENADYHYNLGVALSGNGELAQAARHFRKAIQLRPDYGEAYNNLGNIVRAQGQLDEAMRYYQKALQLLPANTNAHNNLGTILQAIGNVDDAIVHYRKAAEIDPSNTDARYNLANALKASNRLVEATEEYGKAIALKPDFVDAYVNLGLTLKAMGNMDAAIEKYQKALNIEPGSTDLYTNLGNALTGAGKTEEALTYYQKAIELSPRYAEGYYNFGNALKELGNFAGARQCLRDAVALQPDFAAAHCNLSGVLREEGLVDEALSAAHRALELDLDSPIAHSNLFITMHYSGRFNAAAVFQEARRFNARHAKLLMANAPRHTNDCSPGRQLRIGYVSADFRQHPVGFFSHPTLANHDKQHFEIFCYSSVINSDAFTKSFYDYSDQWRDVCWIADSELAEMIRSDHIDILVDLAGHTGGNRLLVFARKPAPVQVTAGGHYDTTGLDAIDYLISDSFHTPPGSQQYFSEELMILPNCYNCYAAPQYAPPISKLPATDHGYITFGCFNNLAKINPEVIALWSVILLELPDARLELQTRGLEDTATRDRYWNLFESNGIAQDRVGLEGGVPHDVLLSRYGAMDIALDPFPYSGGVTTLEALWMGVPVITLTGHVFAGRHSTSHLSNVGLQEFVTNDPEQYVAVTTALARNTNRLQKIRSTLRPLMAASPVCDVKGYTRDLEAAYRHMWERWCGSHKT